MSSTAAPPVAGHEDLQDPSDKDLAILWKNLVNWVVDPSERALRLTGDLSDQIPNNPAVGAVHSGLALAYIDNNTSNRGVVTRRHISKGELLIRIPPLLTLNGQDEDASYDFCSSSDEGTETRRSVSPWLRCLAAYHRATQDDQADRKNPNGGFWAPYLSSLPTSFETLRQWTPQERKCYLAGTTEMNMSLGQNSEHNLQVKRQPNTSGVAASGSSGSDADNDRGVDSFDATVRQRYVQQIRPYLEHCNLLEKPKDTDSLPFQDELEQFRTACQAISTRCFHLQPRESDADSSALSSSYSGPYFLPIIDMLNHSSDEKQRSTTLRRDADGNFVMYAERDLQPGEQVLHSYSAPTASSSQGLSAWQFLQTFGFVPRESILRASFGANSSSSSTSSFCLSPAVLSKDVVLQACWCTTESGVPQKLAARMQGADIEDEAWTVQVDKARNADFITDHLIIDASNPLSDDLVTLACLPFLPQCAYAEAVRSHLDSSILEDYYLGKLVCTSVLRAIDVKLQDYVPVDAVALETDGAAPKDDKSLLKELLRADENRSGDLRDRMNDTKRRRLMYGLTVRLEEKESLGALRKEILALAATLDDEASGDNGGEPALATKRVKL